MKIAAILESQVTAGGAHAQALSSIVQLRRLCGDRHEFELVTTQRENLAALRQLGLDAKHIGVSPVDRLLGAFALNPAWQWLQRQRAVSGPFERALLARDIDLAIFLTQSPSGWLLARLPFIATVYDLAHREHPEFPEVGSAGIHFAREHHFRHNLVRAIAVISASEALSEAIARCYGVAPERLLAMPFSVAGHISGERSAAMGEVLDAWQLREGYYFYPAQFWPHKNHVRIVEALAHLRSSGGDARVVFAGGDQGNRGFIERCAADLGVASHVSILGFVPATQMRGLYQGCCAVVMPTYFGPTNLPPLEAWNVGKPLVYSSHLRADGGEAAVYADPDDALALAEAMRRCLEPEVRDQVVAAGRLRLEEIGRQRGLAEAALLDHLARFAVRRRCAPPGSARQ
jgi:glycosyltransferase involved in cell wall biosynthesis